MFGKDLGVSHPTWFSLSICRKWTSKSSFSGPAGSSTPSAPPDSHGWWLHGLWPVRALQGPTVGEAGHRGATQNRKWSSGRKTKINLPLLQTLPQLLFTSCTSAGHERDLPVPCCHSFATLGIPPQFCYTLPSPIIFIVEASYLRDGMHHILALTRFQKGPTSWNML